MMEFNVGDSIWVSGMDGYGMYIKEGRRAIFRGYLQNNCCLIQYADIPFRKNGLDSCSVMCLLNNISHRNNSQ